MTKPEAKKIDLFILQWTPKLKHVCPSCLTKKVNSDGLCKGCGKEYQLVIGMES